MMNRFIQDKKEDMFRQSVKSFRMSGIPCPDYSLRNVYAKLYGLGYRCIDDQIPIGDQVYPVKFFHRQQRVGKIAKQNILSVFIFGYMPQNADKELFIEYMRGIDRMISSYTEFASGKIKAGMSFCMEQEELSQYIAEYCVRENGVNAFLGNIPLVYERSTGKIYVKTADEKMPLHYSMHMEDLIKAFLRSED